MLLEDEHLRKEVNAHLAKLGLEFKGTSKVRHILRFLHEDVGLEELKQRSDITARARSAGPAEDFSKMIRQGLPPRPSSGSADAPQPGP
jgi:hypothetical protein